MSNNKEKDEHFILIGDNFLTGFLIGGILGILILDAVIKGFL